jgi:hypothetical protein
LLFSVIGKDRHSADYTHNIGLSRAWRGIGGTKCMPSLENLSMPKNILQYGICIYSSSVYTCRREVSLFLQCNLSIRKLVLRFDATTIETEACMNPSKHIDVRLLNLFPGRPSRAGRLA